MRKAKIFFSLLLLFLSCCSLPKQRISIGIDPSWYPLEFYKLNANIYGYIEELFLLISQDSRYDFSRVRSNWDDLIEGLRKKEYDYIVSPMKPFTFREKEFSFSSLMLETGPTLVTQIHSRRKSFQELGGKMVFVPNASLATLCLEKNQNILISFYDSEAMAMRQLDKGEVSAILVDDLKARMYIHDFYKNALQIVSRPLLPEGLRLIGLEGNEKAFLLEFNRLLKRYEKNGKLHALKKKWGLA